MKPIKRILVPVDLSDCASAALRFSVGLARQLGASLEILHAYRDGAYVTADMGYMARTSGPPRTLVQLNYETASQGLARFLDSVPGFDREVAKLVVEAGDPREVICSRAEADDVGLVVMGTHGRTGAMHLLMGSVAERVVRECPRPVLVVRPESAAAAVDDESS